MTQGGREMMADRWRGILGRVDNGVAPGQGYRDFLSYFGFPVSEFPLTYRDELIDEVSVWEEPEKGGEEIAWIIGFTHQSRYSLYGVQF
jgi:hypothetical protein